MSELWMAFLSLGVSALFAGFSKGLVGIGEGVMFHAIFATITLFWPQMGTSSTIQLRVGALGFSTWFSNTMVVGFEWQACRRYWKAGLVFGIGCITNILGAWLLTSLPTDLISTALGWLFVMFALWCATQDVKRHLRRDTGLGENEATNREGKGSGEGEGEGEGDEAASTVPPAVYGNKEDSSGEPSGSAGRDGQHQQEQRQSSNGGGEAPITLSRCLLLEVFGAGAVTGICLGSVGVGAPALVYFTLRRWPKSFMRAVFCMACSMELLVRNATYAVIGMHQLDYWPQYLVVLGALLSAVFIGGALTHVVNTEMCNRFLNAILWLSSLQLLGLYEGDTHSLAALVGTAVWCMGVGLWVLSMKTSLCHFIVRSSKPSSSSIHDTLDESDGISTGPEPALFSPLHTPRHTAVPPPSASQQHPADVRLDIGTNSNPEKTNDMTLLLRRARRVQPAPLTPSLRPYLPSTGGVNSSNKTVQGSLVRLRSPSDEGEDDAQHRGEWVGEGSGLGIADKTEMLERIDSPSRESTSHDSHASEEGAPGEAATA
ncbi:unnamed protein product [Vitrella brassicaformis CCMP3155]|uniref:Uncharacterized protein n=2 Tax=Vitrella brassicaformis TaxID=1169539 RepID=A0A0G4FB67_VITBC|nr:unnamed protein product [Vitrella brassicaformis CCMP3155]|eukprot:CEM10124.1 unnamed protein product [Vitrella brassicaformis CCMP3155]